MRYHSDAITTPIYATIFAGDSGISQFLHSPLNGNRLRLSVTASDIIVPPSNHTPVFPSAGELDSTGSSENELALSAGDLEQLDVTLSEDFEHTYREDERNGLYNPFEGEWCVCVCVCVRCELCAGCEGVGVSGVCV